MNVNKVVPARCVLKRQAKHGHGHLENAANACGPFIQMYYCELNTEQAGYLIDLTFYNVSLKGVRR